MKLRVTRQFKRFRDAIVVEGQTGMDVKMCRGGKCVCVWVGGSVCVCAGGRERVPTANLLSGTL